MDYSTTKQLTKEKPKLVLKKEYKINPQLFLLANSKRMHEGGLRTKGYFKKSYENKPLISIVTVVYNGKKYLKQTIKSVLEQDYDNVEYIIIDGGSTDGTLEIIKKYEEAIDYWVSEADDGIYDAMNKGASLCSGEYVAFLNADDWYNLSTIQMVVKRLNFQKTVDYIFGNVAMYKNNTIEWVFKVNLLNYKSYMPIGHPSLFLKHFILLSEPFDKRYRIVADYDLVLKLIDKKYEYFYIDKIFTNYRIGGHSSTSNLALEHFALWHSHFGLIQAIDSYVSRYIKKEFVRNYKKIKHLIKKLFGSLGI